MTTETEIRAQAAIDSLMQQAQSLTILLATNAGNYAVALNAKDQEIAKLNAALATPKEDKHVEVDSEAAPEAA